MDAKRVWYRSDEMCSVPSLRDLSLVVQIQQI